jgi:hypothetical protein
MWLIGTNLNWADEDDARDSLSGISVSQHSPLTRLGAMLPPSVLPVD